MILICRQMTDDLGDHLFWRLGSNLYISNVYIKESRLPQGSLIYILVIYKLLSKLNYPWSLYLFLDITLNTPHPNLTWASNKSGSNKGHMVREKNK